MEIPVLDKAGKETGRSVALPKEIFGIEPNDHAIYLDVKQIQANKRQGTHASKERSDVAGSTKKLKKQKGTGTARAGDIKSPLFRGGGTMFGPRPRDYGFKLNKKVKRLARKSALTYKAQENGIAVVEAFSMDAPKTKAFLQILQNLNLDAKKTLLVVPEYDKQLYLSSRNLQKSKVTVVADLNTFEILNADNIIFIEGAIEKLDNL
jgi:large subunit ribosomal protein L4